MEAQNPDFEDAFRAVRKLFAEAGFIVDLGIQLEAVGPGFCESSLIIRPKHLQHHNFIHAAVQAALADHTAGAAATTLIKKNEAVLTVEYKLNLLRPAVGERLYCKATVLKPGKTLSIVESEVYVGNSTEGKLVSKATLTMAIIADRLS